MGITEEEEEEEEEVEEVDEFSPVIGGTEEIIEETSAGAESPQETPSEEAKGLGLQAGNAKGVPRGDLLLGKLTEEREPPSPVVPQKDEEKPKTPKKDA